MKRLTPDSIATRALSLGDREGQQAMSMRRIAAELGCDPMAIYRHFPNREALLDAVADLALSDIDDPGPGSGWSTRVARILTDVRATAMRHPGIAAHIAARPPLGANGARLGAGINHALAAAGLPPRGVVLAAQALIAYVAAALTMAVNAGTRDARWHQVSRSMEGLPGDAMPVVGSEEQFGYGLRLLLNGIAVEAGRPTDPNAGPPPGRTAGPTAGRATEPTTGPATELD